MSVSRTIFASMTAVACLCAWEGTALAAAYSVGDVFASVSNGKVIEFTPTGVNVQTLDTGLGGFTTGSTFDSSGNFYVTNFSGNAVSKFDGTGALVGTFGSGYSSPESILFDKAGNAYVGNVGGSLQKRDSTGALVTTYATGRTDWFDLDATASTALYTQEGGQIRSFDLTTNTANPNFTNGGGDFALRILGDGSVLVADEAQIDRFDAAGNLIQSYDTGTNNNWFALNLDPDGTTFWSGDFGTSNVCRFNIASGALVNCFNTGTGSGTLYGLSVFGEKTESGGGPPTTTPEPATVTLLAAGAMLASRYRRRKQAAAC